MKKRKKNQNVMILIISIVLILMIYFTVNIVRFFRVPADTVMIKKGELINYEEAQGFIIREEEVVDTSNYYGISKAKVEDATRVSSGAPIVTYISKEEEQIKDKIEKLDEKIQNAMENRKTIFSNDAKAIDSEIEVYLYTILRNDTDVYSVMEKKNAINEKVEKKAKIVGELSPVGSQIKQLIEERKDLEKELNNSEKSVNASKAGLVSYRVDGYENILTKESLSKLTGEELKKMKITSNQVIPIDTNHVKIINNFECYVAVLLNSEESKKAKLNDEVYLRFAGNGDTLTPATIEYISEEDSERMLVFKIRTYIEELSKFRKVDLDVVWWQDKGLKINKSAISYSEVPNQTTNRMIEMPTVTIKKANYTQKAWIKIVREAGDFAIIDNYTDEELEKMGIGEEQRNNRNTIKMYDEVIITAK